ncbi:MAG: type II toxin-antitoxin system death-on-curing family toxin [bacterium]|nr:type II toxin-antitoxin system death-on-curing family toxin [bacterium]
MIVYLSIEEIMYIHDNMIQIYGGRSDVHDFTLLHSATERSKATFNGKDLYDSLFDKASALIQSLILNHPFDDGNKRTAFTSCAGFLYLNGYELEFTKNEAIAFTLNIDDHTLSFDKISDWLKVHSKKLS